MPEKIQTGVVVCEGGLNNPANPIKIDPGAALISINYEASLLGGYRRVTGFTKYDSAIVPGAGDRVLGVAVFGAGVIAARDNATPKVDIYVSSGSGWGSKINTDTRSNGGKHYFTKYDYTGTPMIIGVDGNNNPFRWDGTTYTLLNGAGSPADAAYVAEFKNHIFYSGYTSNTGAITFSAPLAETDFTAANGAGEIIVGDTVVALRKFRDQLIIFCDNSIFKLVGDSLFNFEVLPITFDIGCAAPDSIQEIGGTLYFLGPDGIRTIAGTERFGDIELASVSRSIQDIIPSILSVSNANITSLAIPSKNQYRLFYSNDSDTVPNALGIIGGNIRTIASRQEDSFRWEWGELKGIKAFCADTDFIANKERVVHGGFDGYIHEQELGNTFNGTNIPAVLQTAYNHLEEPTKRKTIYKTTIFYQAEGTVSISVYLLYDYDDGNKLQPASFTVSTGSGTIVYGAAVYNTDVYGDSALPRAEQTVIGSGNQVSFKFVTEDSNPPHTIQGYTLEYGLGGRR